MANHTMGCDQINPVKHGDVDCVCVWLYSTFHRYAGPVSIQWLGRDQGLMTLFTENRLWWWAMPTLQLDFALQR